MPVAPAHPSKNNTYSYNVEDTEEGVLLAACDTEILGDTYTENGVVLHLKESYYGGEQGDFSAVTSHWEDADMINAAGSNLIAALKEHGYITADEVKTVDGVPFTHVYTLPG